MVARIAVLTAVVTFAVCLAALAQSAEQPLTLTLARPQTGQIAATLTGPAGGVVAITEQGPGGAEAVSTVTLPASGKVTVDRLLPWRCDRAVRQLVATLQAEGGAGPAVRAAIRTPGCR